MGGYYYFVFITTGKIASHCITQAGLYFPVSAIWAAKITGAHHHTQKFIISNVYKSAPGASSLCIEADIWSREKKYLLRNKDLGVMYIKLECPTFGAS